MTMANLVTATYTATAWPKQKKQGNASPEHGIFSEFVPSRHMLSLLIMTKQLARSLQQIPVHIRVLKS